MASFRQKGKHWFFRYTDEHGDRKERRGHWDLATTKAIAAAVEADVSEIKAGYVDAKDLACAKHEARPILEHLEDFRRYLAGKGGSGRHPKVTFSRAKRVVELMKARRISGLSLSAAVDAIQALRASDKSQETINHHVRAVKGFSRWLWKDGRSRDHHLAHLATKDAKGDRRRIRRALEPAEAVKLVKATEAGPVVMGLSGPDRAMLYALAIGTGFRADELATLTPERFNLDARPPTATVLACYAKNGSEAVQPLPASLADRLRPWLARRPPGRPVFDGMTDRTADMLRVDLEAADIAYETASGVLDFHALRGTYISHLVLKQAL
jgi:integrase